MGYNIIEKFENKFSEYIGSKYAIGTFYGRHAIYLALRTIDVKDKEVILPTFTCSVVRSAVILAGAKPIFVDINKNTFNMNLDKLKQKINPNTKAVILHHYFGSVCTNIEEISTICNSKRICLIEDCAWSLGAKYNEKNIGTFGDFGCFSLSKSLINGGGGILITNNKRLYTDAKIISKNNTQKGVFSKLKKYILFTNHYWENMYEHEYKDRIVNKKYKYLLLKYFYKSYLFPFRVILKIKDIFDSRFREYYNSFYDNCEKSENIDVSMYYKQAEISIMSLTNLYDNIRKRRQIMQKLDLNNKLYILQNIKINIVYTPIILKVTNINLTLNNVQKSGINLRFTWPHFQQLSKKQDTSNLRYISNHCLILNLNPDLNDDEIIKLQHILKVLK